VEQAKKTRIMVTKFWTLFTDSVYVSENGSASVVRWSEERHRDCRAHQRRFFHFPSLPEDGSTSFLRNVMRFQPQTVDIARISMTL